MTICAVYDNREVKDCTRGEYCKCKELSKETIDDCRAMIKYNGQEVTNETNKL